MQQRREKKTDCPTPSEQDTEDVMTPLTTNKTVHNQVSDHHDALFCVCICLIVSGYSLTESMYLVVRQFSIISQGILKSDSDCYWNHTLGPGLLELITTTHCKCAEQR